MLWVIIIAAAATAWSCLALFTSEREVRYARIYIAHLQAEADAKAAKTNRRI